MKRILVPCDFSRQSQEAYKQVNYTSPTVEEYKLITRIWFFDHGRFPRAPGDPSPCL